MSRSTIIIAAIIGALAGAGATYLLVQELAPAGRETPAQAAVKTEKKVLYWRAPMDPTFVSERPGKSPMGMDLVPVYEGEDDAAGPSTVSIDPVTVQTIGVRTAAIKRMELIKTVRTVGNVDYDEKRLFHVHTKVEGWVERLYVDQTGQFVEADVPLFEIYSPKLVSAQEEYLLSRKYGADVTEVGRESIVELSRRRLELWDVPAHQIEELEKTGRVKRTLHVHSPSPGIVMERHVTEGMYVMPGMNLYTIADLSRVWVYADVYEYELPWIKAGQMAEITLASLPGRVFRGRVALVYPFMDPRTRTVKVRLEFENPERELKPGMYADVELMPVVRKDAVAVPKEAVIRSGERNIVVLTRGGGRFAPREITLGVEAEGHYEVRAGLKEGDVVVTSAQFLIDSESRLREAVGKMLDAGPAAGRDEGMKHDAMEQDKGAGRETTEHDAARRGETGGEGIMEHKEMNRQDMTPMEHGSKDPGKHEDTGRMDMMEHDSMGPGR